MTPYLIAGFFVLRGAYSSGQRLTHFANYKKLFLLYAAITFVNCYLTNILFSVISTLD
jgi:hypothetical protein